MSSESIADGTMKQSSKNKAGRSTSRRVKPSRLTVCIVSRITAKSEVMKIDIELDVNTDIYPIELDAYYSMVLASSVN